MRPPHMFPLRNKLGGWWRAMEAIGPTGVTLVRNQAATGPDMTSTTGPTIENAVAELAATGSGRGPKCLKFTPASSQWLGGGDFLDPGTGSFTSVVLRSGQWAASQRTFQKRGTGGFGTTDGWQIATGTGGVLDNTGVDDGAASLNFAGGGVGARDDIHCTILWWDGAGNELRLYLDFASPTVLTGAVGDINTTRPVTIGCADNGGGTRSQFYNGRIYEVMYFPSALTDHELQAVRRWVNETYRLHL